MPNLVEILLATYNGGSYLPELLDSLLCQSFQDFRILVRDDGSTDSTFSCLQAYAERFPEKFKLLPSDGHLGVIGNFNTLLDAAEAQYIFFCDQDDIWEPLKIEKIVGRFQSVPSTCPTLIHSDLALIDDKLKPLHPSFWKYSHLDPEKGNLIHHLLVQNHVTGCSMAINRSLANLVPPIPKEALMHDWWIALIASSLGQIIAVADPLVRYRQHSQNTLGARQSSGYTGIKKLLDFLFYPEFYSLEASKRQKQAEALFNRFQKKMNPATLKTLSTFLKAPQMSLLERKRIYLTHRFYRQGWKKIIPYLFQNRPI